jgi:hypothetical protein
MKKVDLNKLYKAGLISSKPFNYFEIKDKVKQYTCQGITKTEAVNKTSKMLGVSEVTIWKALKATSSIDLT